MPKANPLKHWKKFSLMCAVAFLTIEVILLYSLYITCDPAQAVAGTCAFTNPLLLFRFLPKMVFWLFTCFSFWYVIWEVFGLRGEFDSVRYAKIAMASVVFLLVMGFVIVPNAFWAIAQSSRMVVAKGADIRSWVFQKPPIPANETQPGSLNQTDVNSTLPSEDEMPQNSTVDEPEAESPLIWSRTLRFSRLDISNMKHIRLDCNLTTTISREGSAILRANGKVVDSKVMPGYSELVIPVSRLAYGNNTIEIWSDYPGMRVDGAAVTVFEKRGISYTR